LIVFDASVVVSAALKLDGVPERALLRAEEVDVFALSASVDAELAAVLARPTTDYFSLIPDPDKGDRSARSSSNGHSRESGNPGVAASVPIAWVPTFAGMTTRWSGMCRHQLEPVLPIQGPDHASHRAAAA
jgi:hypothetical protein